jgi:hypothetical protein
MIEVIQKKMLDRFVVKKCKPNTSETESGNSTTGSSASNVSDTSAVCSVISKTITNNNAIEDCVHQTFPTYCKKEQWLQKLDENEWLMIQNGIHGCRTCNEVEFHGIHKTQGLKLCMEWKECIVSSFGDNEEK